MVQKTKRNRKSQSRNRSSRSSRSSRSRTQHIIRKMDEHEHEHEPITEQHHFYSKMVYDGNTMLTESQKDDEPIQRRKYTLKQLEREIPIGAELIKTHLDHKVPLALNKPTPKEIKFTSVLPNPRDLGLIPPRIFTRRHKHKHNKRDNENIRLVIEDQQYDDNNQPRNFFDLP